VHRWRVGEVEIVRIEDESFALPSDHPAPAWAVPDFAPTPDQVGIAFSAFAIADGDRRIVVDPWLANDAPRSRDDAADHVERLLGELDDAGFPAASVDAVVNTHFDGIGWNTRPGVGAGPWLATFANARYLYPRRELDTWRAGGYPSGDDGLGLLEREGRLDAVDLPHGLTPHVRLDDAPGHNAGHLAVTIESNDALAVMPGHLFLNPFQVSDPTQAADLDPVTATATRRRLLAELAARDGLLLTTLLGGPGGGRVRRDGDSFALAI
jgi:hypothetical protein